MTSRRIHDYALIAKILTEEPGLEQRLTALVARYTELHPQRLRMSVESMRYILKRSWREILGRPYRPGPRNSRRHDYAAIKAILTEQPALAGQPAKVAKLYQARTGMAIHPQYIVNLRDIHPEEILPPAEDREGEAQGRKGSEVPDSV